MFTAITTKPKLYEFMRSAIACSACSDGAPSWISATTRENSFAVGSAPSWTHIATAWLKAWPALSDAAIVISVSGSWFSNIDSRFFAFILT